MHRIFKFLTSRLIFIVPLVLLQFYLFALLLYQSVIYYRILPFIQIVEFLTVVYIINRPEEPSYKIGWCIAILGVPAVGLPLYILAGNKKMPKKLIEGTTQISKRTEGLLRQPEGLLFEKMEESRDILRSFKYGMETCGFPAFRHSRCVYYSSGEEWLEAYKDALRSAKHFIFMEFFIIVEGSVWDEIHEILKEKVKEGVEVKLIYDDFGSVSLPLKYDVQLREEGIDAWRFNKLRPAFIIQMNNRDHRKITVIDNTIAFTGGVNLADEYANRIQRFGYWKDSAVRLDGEAVWSFTVMFLGLYTYLNKDASDLDFLQYKLDYEDVNDGGIYQPFSDTPTDDENVCLNLHMNMINHAEKYLYIDTPYLILPEALRRCLRLSAKNGVDVRIMVPGIADKVLVNQITRHNYSSLLSSGVRIYEYTPGFVHAKNFVSDDKYAIVGSVNTDYRSYYLHFEDGVFMYDSPAVKDIRDDFLESLKDCHEITEEEVKKTNVLLRILRAVLNMFIQLL